MGSVCHGLWLLVLLPLIRSRKHCSLHRVIAWVLRSVQHCIECVGEGEAVKRVNLLQVKILGACPLSVADGKAKATENK